MDAVAAIDTGSNVLVGPGVDVIDFYDDIKNTLGVTYTMVTKNGLNTFTLPCDKFPNLLIKFSDAVGTTFTIPSSNLRGTQVGQNCQSKLISKDELSMFLLCSH